jgi:hypothetical protein
VHKPPTSAPGAFGNLGALVLRNHPWHLDQAFALRAIPKRILEQDQLRVQRLKLLDHEPWMRIMPGESVWRYDHPGIELPTPGCITPPVAGRAIAPGAADTIIAILMLGQQGPSVVLHVLFESVPLSLDGPFLLLLMGRDARRECAFHDCPPGVPE